jgi:hypothetical protein
MPVYLCNPGAGQPDPWRHGIQVYSAPFDIGATTPSAAAAGRDLAVAVHTARTGSDSEHNSNATRDEGGGRPSFRSEFLSTASGGGRRESTAGHPIRRVRHAEIVLVDDVCVAYQRYWLRLRWPGHKGGFAGYIAMGSVDKQKETEGMFHQSSEGRYEQIPFSRSHLMFCPSLYRRSSGWRRRHLVRSDGGRSTFVGRCGSG